MNDECVKIQNSAIETLIYKKLYLVSEKHRVIEKLNLNTPSQHGPLLCGHILIHVLHREADAVGDVTKESLIFTTPP